MSTDSLDARLDVLFAEYEALSARLPDLDGPDRTQEHAAVCARLKAIRAEVIALPCTSLAEVLRKTRFTALTLEPIGGFAGALDEDLSAGNVHDITLAWSTLRDLIALAA